MRNNLFFLLMFCFAAAILGDSTAEALLLARFGPSFVPHMFLVNAVVLFLLSAGMLSIVDRIDRRKLFFKALLVHGLVLLLLRSAVNANWDFLFLPLFSYAYSSKILFFLLFWTVANDLIDSRRAGKEFPFIAAGGTIGAIGVSFLIPGLMRYIAIENLLLLWALLVVAASLLLIPLRKHYRYQFKASGPDDVHEAKPGLKPGISLLLLLRDEPLLRSMSLLYFNIFFLLLNQHIAFYKEVKGAFSSAGEIAAFLGSFNGFSMLSTCLLQVGLAGILLRRLGSTRSMLLLPTALLVIFIALAIISSLSGTGSHLLFWAVIIGMGIRIAFFDSFFSPNFQLFFSSLPKEIRGRGKLLIEGVIKPLAMVIAGCFLLWIVPKLSFRVHMSLMAIVAAGAVFQAIRLKHAYTKTLARCLTGMPNNVDTALLERMDFHGDEDILSFLAKQLEHEDFEVQKFLIEIIASAGNDEAAALLLEYLYRADAKLRATIIVALGNFPETLVAERLTSFLTDNEPRVVANAVSALSQCKAGGLETRLEPLLYHPHRRVRVNTILALWPVSDAIRRNHFYEILQSMLDGDSSADCASALYAIGELSDGKATDLLFGFCAANVTGNYRSEMVRNQAVQVLGKKRCPQALELLLQMVRHATSRQRKSLIVIIGSMLPFVDERCWRDGIVKGNAVHRNCLVQALRKARVTISAEAAAVLGISAIREIEAIEWERQSLQVLSLSGARRMALLSCAIREELIAIRLETLLNLIALLDSSGVIGSVIQRINHSDAHVRARALETIENTGDEKINRSIITVIEWLDTLPPLPAGKGVSAQKKEVMVAGTYCASHNEWVAICAGYACDSSETVKN